MGEHYVCVTLPPLQDPRIPLPVVAQALAPLIYTDSLIPHSIGQAQRSWYVPGSPTLTYVVVPDDFTTRHIANEAEMLAAVAFLISLLDIQELDLDEAFMVFFKPWRFMNCVYPQYFLTRLSSVRIQMIFGNIDYNFRLGHCDHDQKGITIFRPGPELKAACQDLYRNSHLFDYRSFSQPFTRRVYRSLARRDIQFNTPYTAEQLCHILRLYTAVPSGTGYNMCPISLNQIRKRLYRVQHELTQARFISGIRQVNTGNTPTLRFLPGTATLPQW